MKNYRFPFKEIVPIAVALIGIIGTIYGVHLGSSLTAEANRNIVKINYQNELLQQRIKSLDRAAAIFGKSPGIQDIWGEYIKINYDSTDNISKHSRELAEYNAEFNSVIHLSSLYFGPKTKEAIKSMGAQSSPWWTKSTDEVSNYLAAMASELKYNIE